MFGRGLTSPLVRAMFANRVGLRLTRIVLPRKVRALHKDFHLLRAPLRTIFEGI